MIPAESIPTICGAIGKLLMELGGIKSSFAFTIGISHVFIWTNRTRQIYNISAPYLNPYFAVEHYFWFSGCRELIICVGNRNCVKDCQHIRGGGRICWQCSQSAKECESTNQRQALHENFAISEFQDLDLIPPNTPIFVSVTHHQRKNQKKNPWGLTASTCSTFKSHTNDTT